MKDSLQRTCLLGLSLLSAAFAISLPCEARAQRSRDRLLPLPREIERALIYNSARDFFRQGAERFEREIQGLRERKSTNIEIEPGLLETERPSRPEHPVFYNPMLEGETSHP
ncbi:MAG: hypothetical protein SVX43_03025 [Cyanobacteriota bacterium]|nr:hypothetical protein [Cyanobacteriota bacterium]